MSKRKPAITGGSAALFILTAFSACGKGLDTTFVVVDPTLEVRSGLKQWYKASQLKGNPFNYDLFTNNIPWPAVEGLGPTLAKAGTGSIFYRFGAQINTIPEFHFVDFSGFASAFQNTASGIGTGLTGFTFFYVGSAPTTGDLIGISAGTSSAFSCPTYDFFAVVSNTLNWQFNICKGGSSSYGATVTATTGAEMNATRILSGWWSTAEDVLTFEVNGFAQMQSGAIGAASLNLSGAAVLGTLTTSSSGKVYEYLFYDRRLSSSEISQVRAYLLLSQPTL